VCGQKFKAPLGKSKVPRNWKRELAGETGDSRPTLTPDGNENERGGSEGGGNSCRLPGPFGGSASAQRKTAGEPRANTKKVNHNDPADWG